jgi:hypothetical protein
MAAPNDRGKKVPAVTGDPVVANSTEGRQKQRLYRDVNKRIREVVGTLPANRPVGFLCECGQDGCAATIELTHAQWGSIFSEDESVLLTAEHVGAVADGRRVIPENGRFSLVATA